MCVCVRANIEHWLHSTSAKRRIFAGKFGIEQCGFKHVHVLGGHGRCVYVCFHLVRYIQALMPLWIMGNFQGLQLKDKLLKIASC